MRPKTGRNGKPTNVYLDPQIKRAGRIVAKQRYKLSLSALINGLLKREMSLKKGILRGGSR